MEPRRRARLCDSRVNLRMDVQPKERQPGVSGACFALILVSLLAVLLIR